MTVTIKSLAPSAQEIHFHLETGNTVYSLGFITECGLEIPLGERMVILDNKGAGCYLVEYKNLGYLVNKNDFSVFPNTEGFKAYLKDCVLIKKYEKKGVMVVDLDEESQALLDEVIECYFEDLDESYYNEIPYFIINKKTFGFVEYDPATCTFDVINLNNPYTTTSFELAMKSSYEYFQVK